MCMVEHWLNEDIIQIRGIEIKLRDREEDQKTEKTERDRHKETDIKRQTERDGQKETDRKR